MTDFVCYQRAVHFKHVVSVNTFPSFQTVDRFLRKLIWLITLRPIPNTRAIQKDTEPFFLIYCCTYNLIKTCLLQSTPLYCWYTAPSVFSNSTTRPGTCFAGWREGPVANFLLSPLPSQIGDLLGWTSTLGTGKSPQGPNLESRGLGHDIRLLLCQKFTDKKRREGRCIVMVQHPGLVCPRLRPLPSHYFPQTLHDLQVKLFIDCLTTWNKLMTIPFQ